MGEDALWALAAGDIIIPSALSFAAGENFAALREGLTHIHSMALEALGADEEGDEDDEDDGDDSIY